MTSIDWNLILETIRAERCVMILGPDFSITKDRKSIRDAMLEYLKIEEDAILRGLKFNKGEGLFQYSDPILRTRTYFKLKAFFREISKDLFTDMYEKVAQINFHLIISVSPDLFLAEVMDRHNISHNFEYYNKTVNPRDVRPPSVDHPLLYNLFGSIDEEQSLILSHRDLYDFIFAILGNRHLPLELQNSLQSAANIIFLGFNFEKWYMQLLLRMFNLQDEKFHFDRYASSEKLSSEVQVFLQEQFRINFIQGKTEDFISILYDKCKEANLLRNLNAPTVSLQDKVLSAIKEDEFDRAIELMSAYFKETGQEDLGDDLVLLSSRYKRLKRKQSQDIIAEDEANIEENKIRAALLETSKEVKA